MEERDEGECLFNLLPEEILRHCFSFMNIPSISALSLTCKPENYNVSYYANEPTTWAELVDRRFYLGVLSPQFGVFKKRPNLYGGSDWKTAYRTMSCCNRMPSNRFTSKRKVVFAKGGGIDGYKKSTNIEGEMVSNKQQNPFQDKSSRTGGNVVSLWVMLGHTDDCNTRTAGSISSVNNNQRYIELHLCVQNVKSGSGSMDVNISEASVQLLGGTGPSDMLPSQIVTNGPMKPKLLLRKGGSNDLDVNASLLQKKRKDRRRRQTAYGHSSDLNAPDLDGCSHSFSLSDDKENDLNCLTLKPFEYVIVSVHIPCPSNMRYETDFLTRALCVNVPVSTDPHYKFESNQNTCGHLSGPDVSTNDGIRVQPQAVTACFLAENEIWNYYMELPGGVLTMTDRFAITAA